jgi:hypothetical protein
MEMKVVIVYILRIFVSLNTSISLLYTLCKEEQEFQESLAAFRNHLDWKGELVMGNVLRSSYTLNIRNLGEWDNYDL